MASIESIRSSRWKLTTSRPVRDRPCRGGGGVDEAPPELLLQARVRKQPPRFQGPGSDLFVTAENGYRSTIKYLFCSRVMFHVLRYFGSKKLRFFQVFGGAWGGFGGSTGGGTTRGSRSGKCQVGTTICWDGSGCKPRVRFTLVSWFVHVNSKEHLCISGCLPNRNRVSPTEATSTFIS